MHKIYINRHFCSVCELVYPARFTAETTDLISVTDRSLNPSGHARPAEL